MKSSKLALVALATVSLALTTPAAGKAAPRHCPRTYSAHEFARAARVAYRGTREPSRRDFGELHKFARCQRQARSSALAFWARERAAWRQRRLDASHPWHYGTASWYEDAGATASGYHAGYGVANLSLPFGTRVEFMYHDREVTATVDDRGPYVSGREWDLNQTTAGALGFSGVDTVAWRLL